MMAPKKMSGGSAKFSGFILWPARMSVPKNVTVICCRWDIFQSGTKQRTDKTNRQSRAAKHARLKIHSSGYHSNWHYFSFFFCDTPKGVWNLPFGRRERVMVAGSAWKTCAVGKPVQRLGFTSKRLRCQVVPRWVTGWTDRCEGLGLNSPSGVWWTVLISPHLFYRVLCHSFHSFFYCSSFTVLTFLSPSPHRYSSH